MNDKEENKASLLIEKMMKHYEIFTISELGIKIGVSQPYISAWKKNNNIKAIMKKCKKLGIYSEIFNEITIENKKLLGGDILSEYFSELKMAAKIVDKEKDLIEDIKELIKKYKSLEFFEETNEH